MAICNYHEDGQSYEIPVELAGVHDDKIVIRFAAGNGRFVNLGNLSPASPLDVQEFEQARRRYEQ